MYRLGMRLGVSGEVPDMATPALAYSTALFPSFYDSMVDSLPPEFEVAESHGFYSNLALKSVPEPGGAVKILDLCTGTGSIPRCIAKAWADKCGKESKCRIIGVDNSEEMLKVARRGWIEVSGVNVEWKLGTLGQEGALAGVDNVDLAVISAGSFHHLRTHEEQLIALREVKASLKEGGLLVMNLFGLDEIVEEVSSGDHGGQDVWHLKDGFWKQTLSKEVETLEDGGITGTETFKVGCEMWNEEMVCKWTLRAVWWEDVRELCEELGLVILQEFHSFRDALDGSKAALKETGETGRIFVIQKQNEFHGDVQKMATPTLAYNTALFPFFYDAMVTSLPVEFEVLESRTFYTNLALNVAPETDVDVKVLDLCTGTGRISRDIAAAWSKVASKCRSCNKNRSLQLIGLDNSEEMLKAARREWIQVPDVEVEWMLGTLGQRGALASVRDIDLAIVSAGSFHLLTTYEEQLVAMGEVKESLKVGGILVLNLFGVDEIVEEVSLGDHGGLDIWHLNDGFWKQTLDKEVETLEDGGITGTETFKVGCKKWNEEMVCKWTLRAVWWEDVRELCEEVGLVVQKEFRSFADALCGRTADTNEIGDAGDRKSVV